MKHRTRIMSIECKNGENDLAGPARIGRGTFSKTGSSLWYDGRRFKTLDGAGFKTNYIDIETRERYWISGCHKDGADALYSTTVEIDEDVREVYWTEIRRKPESKGIKSFHCAGKYSK